MKKGLSLIVTFLVCLLLIGATSWAKDPTTLKPVPLKPGTTAQPAATAATPQDQANGELELMAKDIASLCNHPGFLGFLRSEIAQSKNREQIVELDQFLDRAAKHQGMPANLAATAGKVKETKARHKAMNLARLEGFDLYIPVGAHKAKWKGGKDFIVAVSPYGDDMALQSTVGYSVSDGRRVILDARQPPETVVMVIAPEEHETHVMPSGSLPAVDSGPLPPPHFTGKDMPHKPVPQTQGNSYVGIHRLYIRDVKEPWTRGDPEIKIFYGSRRGNYCNTFYVQGHGSLSASVDYVNKSKYWYTTWSAPNVSQCGGRSYTNSHDTCWYFDTNDYDRIAMYIYEDDGGNRKSLVWNLYPGVSCSWGYYDGDDYVDSAAVYKSNFPFDYDFNQDLGNAYVTWHKVH